MTRKPLGCALAGLAALALASCDSAYYRTLEAFGKHKRDILVERVEEARDDQEEAKQQFKTALERFTEIVHFEGGDLEAKYNQLKGELEVSEAKAASVTRRIDAVEDVADALFDEWEDELDDYRDEDLRLSSEIKLRTTQQRYARLLRAMKRAESKMEPVLGAFRDQVLFLKHNLNARAIASLGDTVVELELDVARLISEMEASIQEADEFIETMGSVGSE